MTTIRTGSIGARIIALDNAVRILAQGFEKSSRGHLSVAARGVLDAGGPPLTYSDPELDVVTREAVAKHPVDSTSRPESTGKRILDGMPSFIHAADDHDPDSFTVSHTEWLNGALAPQNPGWHVLDWAVEAIMSAERIMWQLDGKDENHHLRLTKTNILALSARIRATRSRSLLYVGDQASDYIMVRWMANRPRDLAVAFKRGDLVEVATRHVRAYKAIQHAIRKGAES